MTHPTDALRLVPVEKLQQIRANEFKKNQSDTYAAADRAPVALIKGIGMSQPVITHVLMACEDYQALVERKADRIPWQHRQIEDDGVGGYRYKAAPASPLPGGGWQDISTAPKDGTLIMVGAPDCGVSLVRWMLDAWIDEQGFTQGSWPTHWMPLPAAPTGDAK